MCDLYILLKKVVLCAVVRMIAFFPRLASQSHYINMYTPIDRDMHVQIDIYGPLNPIVFCVIHIYILYYSSGQ